MQTVTSGENVLLEKMGEKDVNAEDGTKEMALLTAEYQVSS